MTDLHDDGALDSLEKRIDGWLAGLRAHNPAILAIDKAAPCDVGAAERRWYVRLRGEAKDVTTVWLTVGQRTLRYETYVLPAPEEHQAELAEHLLRRNDRLVGAHYSIGAEDAVYLRGDLPLQALDEPELDRVIGTLYEQVERDFPRLLALAFASRLAGRT